MGGRTLEEEKLNDDGDGSVRVEEEACIGNSAGMNVGPVDDPAWRGD